MSLPLELLGRRGNCISLGGIVAVTATSYTARALLLLLLFLLLGFSLRWEIAFSAGHATTPLGVTTVGKQP